MRKSTSECAVKYLVVFLSAALLIGIGGWAAAAEKMTPEKVVEITDKVIALVGEKGEAAFPELKGPDFVFGETYPTVVTTDGAVLFHAVKPHLEGKNLLGLKDRNGKMFVSEIIAVANEKGSGWVEYVWPKPGEKKASPKVSYVKKGKMDGKDIVCMVGLYDVTKESCEKQTGK